jgi:hypothetical protein
MPRSSWHSVGPRARRPFYEFHTSTQSPLAAEVLARIARLYEIEADIRGQTPIVRRDVRQLRSRALVEDLHLWLQAHVPRVPGWSDLAKAMRYALRHWDGLILYLDDGRLEMDTNVVERAIRPVTITRKNSLFWLRRRSSSLGDRRYPGPDLQAQRRRVRLSHRRPAAVHLRANQESRAVRTAAVELAFTSHARCRIAPLPQLTSPPSQSVRA